MRLATLLAVAGILAACGSGSTCDASNCATGCCLDGVCHPEFGDTTCSSGGSACVACNTALERCRPDTRTCSPFVTIGIDYTLLTQVSCVSAGPCHADTRVFATDYPTLAADPRASTCSKVLLHPATATSPAAYGWSGCAYCGIDACCLTPWGGQVTTCSFVLPGSW